MDRPSGAHWDRRSVQPPRTRAEETSLSPHAVEDLEAIAQSMEALEIQFCILSVQMQYDHSPFSMRTMDLTRQLGEIHEKLENVVTFGT